MHPNEKRLRDKYEQLNETCPRCKKNLILTNCGSWCPNPNCTVTIATKYNKK